MIPELLVPTWLQDLAEEADSIPEVGVPLKALLRAAFRRGDRRTALLQDWRRIEEWPAGPTTYCRNSIVIPVRGAHEQLEMCLACLWEHTPPEELEVIVVCPEEELKEVTGLSCAFRPSWPGSSFHIISTGQPLGFPAACNFGARKATGDVLVFLNSDAYVGPGWLKKLLAVLTPLPDGGVRHVAAGPMGTNVSGVQVARFEPIGESIKMERSVETIRRVTDLFASQCRVQKPFPSRRLVGFCLAVERGAFEAVGGWYEGWPVPLGNWDDDDLCLRLTLLCGASACMVVPDLLVVHEGHASFAELPDADKTLGEALRKNGEHFRRRWGWLIPEWKEWLDKEGAR